MKSLNLIFTKEKTNDLLSFKPDDSSEEEKIFFPYIKTDLENIKNEYEFNLKKNKENSNYNNYFLEKGIIINPICKSTKNKYYFGSKKIKNDFCENERNINSSNKNKQISLDKTKDSNFTNIFDENKENNNLLTFNKITEYKSRNKYQYSKENINNMPKKNLFSNETLSSCCKDLFRKRFNKLNNKKNSTLKASYEKFHLTFNDFLSNNHKVEKNSRNQLFTNKILKDQNHKTMYNKTVINSKINNGPLYKGRKKYIFKCNPYMIKNKFVDLPESIKLLNKNYIKLLHKEADKYFGYSFIIIQKEKFPYKYRNPLLNNNLVNDNNTERNKKMEIINENIIPGTDIINEINDTKNKELIPKKKINKKKLISKFKSSLIKNINYIKCISFCPSRFIQKNYIIDTEDSKNLNYYIDKNQKTTELIQAIKTNNYDLSCDLIEKNNSSVRDCDIFKFSPLHWAVKKNFYIIIPKLISYGAQIDFQNFLGDTPLHISIKKNYYECTVLLLIYLASPFIKDNKGKKPFDFCKDYQMNIIYKKIMHLHYKNMLAKNKIIYDNIQNQFIKFILEEFSTQLKRDCLIIVEDIQREKKNRADIELKLKKRKI